MNYASSSWTHHDLLQLRQGYERKIPLRDLALQLGRSPTAINKALTRFHIRPTRATKKALESKRVLFFRSTPRGRKKDEPSVMASLSDMMFYLQAHGYAIQARLFTLNQQACPFYLVNQRPSSPVRILVLANTLRLEQHLPIFRTNDIALSAP